MTKITTHIPIVQSDDGLRVASTDIAQGAGVEHRAALQLIQTHQESLEEFGQVAFEMRAGYNNAQVRVAMLNEHQSTLLLTMMRNTPQVVAFKVALVKAFFDMAQHLVRRPLPSGPELLALAIVEAQQMIAAKDHQIAILEPKASAWDALVSSTGSVSFRDAAKIISEDGGVTIGGVHLIDKLMAWGWIFRPTLTADEKRRGKKTRSIRAYQTQINAGTLTEKAKHYTDQETGEQKLSNNPQTRVTGKGLDRIRTRLLNEKVAA